MSICNIFGGGCVWTYKFRNGMDGMRHKISYLPIMGRMERFEKQRYLSKDVDVVKINIDAILLV